MSSTTTAGRSVDGKGELVCTRPFPSMPLGFWNDRDGARYRAAYFERFPGVWCHGDFAEWTGHGGMIIHGRSDATLNPGGVRIGTGEIYRQVEQIPEVVEALCIGQDWQGDVRIVLFVRLAAGGVLDEPLAERIKTIIRTGASPRHVPARIVAVDDIPRTKSGKIVELAVRDIVHGRDVKNAGGAGEPGSARLFPRPAGAGRLSLKADPEHFSACACIKVIASCIDARKARIRSKYAIKLTTIVFLNLGSA